MACDGGPGVADSGPERTATGAALAPASAWSRSEARGLPEGAASAGDLRVDPGALDRILRAVPTSRPGPTGDDGGTRVGLDTGLPMPEAGVDEAGEPAPPTKRPFVAVGETREQPALSSAGIERALRAELYWILVHRCRDPDGKILPPDAITVEFRIEADGRISPSSIVAQTREPRFEEAADCMRREIAAATFSGPAAALGATTLVTATIPSVD